MCARACVRVGMGLVLVCLRVSCGAPPRPPALDPPLVVPLNMKVIIDVQNDVR